MATVNILDAANHYYDNSATGLTAVNTQDAIDEIKLAVEQTVTSILELGITDGSAGQLLTTNGSGVFTFEDAPIALPDQTGHTGKFLTTDGSTASWSAITDQGLSTTSDVSFNTVTATTFTGALSGNATTATTASTANAVALNSVTLGTHTQGNFVSNVSGGNGITVTGTPGEGWTPTIAVTNVTRSDSASSAAPVAGATFTVIDSITTNARGQVTGVNVKTVTTPAMTIYDVNDVVIANV